MLCNAPTVDKIICISSADGVTTGIARYAATTAIGRFITCPLAVRRTQKERNVDVKSFFLLLTGMPTADKVTATSVGERRRQKTMTAAG